MSSSQNQNIWIAIKHRQKFVCKYRKEIESILEHRFFCVYRSSISDFFYSYHLSSNWSTYKNI